MRHHRAEFMLLLAAIAIPIIVGCGGGGGGGSSVAPQPINSSPSLAITSPSSNPVTLDVRENQSVKLCFSAQDPDGGDLSYICTWDAGSVTPATGTLEAGASCEVNFRAPNYNGLSTVTIRISDGQANCAKTVQINVIGASSEPQNELRILSISANPKSVVPEGNAALTASVQNPGGKALTYSWQSIYGRLQGNGAGAMWTAPSMPGVYGVFVTVADGTSSVTYGVAVTVAGPEGGVLGQYFKTVREKNVVYLETEMLRRTDPDINFNWWQTSPDPAKLGTDGWGARWTGYIKAQAGGTYSLRVHADDGARMRVMNDAGVWVDVVPDNNRNWMDHVEGAWLPDQPVALQLDGGKWYPFILDYFEGGENAFIILYWSVNGGPEEIVPQTAFRPQ